jgi:hypothetical protein
LCQAEQSLQPLAPLPLERTFESAPVDARRATLRSERPGIGQLRLASQELSKGRYDQRRLDVVDETV